MVYGPGQDSFLLLEFLKERAREKRVLDVGTGSGILARAAIEAGASEVVATDIDETCLSDIHNEKIKTVNSDLFENVEGLFDLIVFNPPYLPLDEGAGFSPETTGGVEGYEIIFRFLERAREHLSGGGVVLFAFSSLSEPEEIKKKLSLLGYSFRVVGEKHLFFETIFACEAWLEEK